MVVQMKKPGSKAGLCQSERDRPASLLCCRDGQNVRTIGPAPRKAKAVAVSSTLLVDGHDEVSQGLILVLADRHDVQPEMKIAGDDHSARA